MLRSFNKDLFMDSTQPISTLQTVLVLSLVVLHGELVINTISYNTTDQFTATNW